MTGKVCPEPYVDEYEWEKFKNRITIEEEKEMAEKVYKYTSELPDWARPTIQKLLDKGYYNGASPDNLNLPESIMRTMVILDRVGIFDR